MNKRKLKGLFVTHNYGLYGASQSLKLLLRNQKNIDATLVIPRREMLSQQDKERIGQRFGVEATKIKQFFLPWINCFEGRKTDLQNYFLVAAKNLLWKIDRNRFHRYVSAGGFDFIHLNSIVLCGIISESHPFIIHIRERLIHYREWVLSQVEKAKGVIFIDDSVVPPFLPIDIKDSVILTNPVDMRNCTIHTANGNPFGNQTVFTMIGRIEEGKGVDFVIDAFRNTSGDQMRLLIIGDKGDGIHGGFVKHCRELAAGDPRISFWGEEKNISKIYTWCDYIIRGEVDFRMGRSVLEALYSDCDVIVPIRNDQSVKTNEELTKFKSKVHTYLPRDMGSLAKTFLNLSGRKAQKLNFHSNINGYVKTFNEYISNVL